LFVRFCEHGDEISAFDYSFVDYGCTDDYWRVVYSFMGIRKLGAAARINLDASWYPKPGGSGALEVCSVEQY
jgi:hypothetical protein